MGHRPEGPRRLSFLKSPLIVTEKPNSTESSQYGHTQSSQYGITEENTMYDPEHGTRLPQLGVNDAGMHETPQFERHEEATTIELFYDLFFVANLTTFTSLHEINEAASLRSYSGFFCILWFTWCQVSLFDVRFVADSFLERVAKACQFAVMIGLAVVGPKFDPSKQDSATFRTMALILMFGRLVLSAQYLVVLFHVRNYKKSKTPMALLSFIYLIAAVVYGLTWFGFREDKIDKTKTRNPHTYIAWYAIAVVETILNVGVTSRWKVVSFKGTHLVQRMSLLTLIIMGEGIIVVTKSISKIVKTQKARYAWTPATIGAITAAVLVVYLLYMLYFDWYSHHHFGSIRQQIWAILHFPFHLALVLFMEGMAQSIIWRKLVEVVTSVSASFGTTYQAWSLEVTPSAIGLTVAIPALQASLSAMTKELMVLYPPEFAQTYLDVEDSLVAINATTLGATPDMTATEYESILGQIEAIVTRLQFTFVNSVFSTYGVVLPEKKDIDTSAEDRLEANFEVFGLVFVYFFVAAGLTLLLMNTLNMLSKPKKGAMEWLKVGFNYLVGVVLCCLSALSVTDAGTALALTSWVIPTVAIPLALVLAINHLHRFWKH